MLLKSFSVDFCNDVFVLIFVMTFLFLLTIYLLIRIGHQRGHLRVDKHCIFLGPVPMSSKAHQAHIALSEPMTSKVQQGSNLSSSPTFLSPNPYINPTIGSLTLCQVLSGGRQRQIVSLLDFTN